MKKWVGYGFVVLAALVAYQGYMNSLNEVRTQEMARSVACDVDSQCVLEGEHPHIVRTDVIQRRYEFRSTVGPIAARCRRDFIFLGAWSCEAEKGSLAGRI